MTFSIQAALGLAAACTIGGVVFLWLFKVRHWRYGDDPYMYSRTLAAFTTMFFLAVPLLIWYGTTEETRLWTLQETLAATAGTWLALTMYTRSAKKDLQARLAKQRRKK